MAKKPLNLKIDGISGYKTTEAYYELDNIYNTYLGVQCTFINADRSRWMPLIRGWNFMRPHYFEQYYGKIAVRDAYNKKNFERCEKGGRGEITSCNGFVDVTTPIVSQGHFLGTLMAGPFRIDPFTADELRGMWREMTGRLGAIMDPDFRRYVRMALETPVLGQDLKKGIVELLDLSAELIGGGDAERIRKRADALRPLFGRYLPHAYWVDWVIGHNKFYFKPDRSDHFSTWEREEFGLQRFPTTVLAIMPNISGRREDLLDTLVRAVEVQYACTQIAREFPETVAGVLEDYGVLFLTSSDPQKNITQARLEIRDRARAIAMRLQQRFKVPFLTGIGSSSPRGEELNRSYQEAVSSLHLCAQTAKPMISFGEASLSTGSSGLAMKRNSVRLTDAYERGSKTALRMARDRFLEHALISCSQSPEVLRAYLSSAFFDLLEAFRRRHAPLDPEYESLAESLDLKLRNPSGIQELLAAFKDVLEAVISYGERPQEARSKVRLERVKRYVDERFSEPITLASLARKFSFSVPTLHRGFKNLTGRTFGSYLFDRRIKEAKRILASSDLPLEGVAHACGFNSSSYFVQAFKRSTRTTPGHYRSRKSG